MALLQGWDALHMRTSTLLVLGSTELSRRLSAT